VKISACNLGTKTDIEKNVRRGSCSIRNGGDDLMWVTSNGFSLLWTACSWRLSVYLWEKFLLHEEQENWRAAWHLWKCVRIFPPVKNDLLQPCMKKKKVTD
jgi:hypothetical protein